MCRKYGGDRKCYIIEFTNPKDKKLEVLDECGRDNAQVRRKKKDLGDYTVFKDKHNIRPKRVKQKLIL